MIEKGLIINNLDQNTEEWLAWRNSGIGGSDAAVIKLGDVYGKTPYRLWMEKRGNKIENTSYGGDENMKRGHDLEPIAKAFFIENTGIHIKPMLMQSRAYPFMLASLDGMSTDLKVGVEIKAPGEKIFNQMLTQGIPDHYYAQVQHELFVTGAERFYFFAYRDDKTDPFIREILPDYGYIENLVRMEQSFWRHIEYGIPPVESIDMQSSLSLFMGLIMFSGFANAGKDEIGKLYMSMFDMKRFAFSDPLREIHAMVLGKSQEEILENKEAYRPQMVILGHEMRRYVPNVWIESILNETSGIFEAMKERGAIIPSTRYVNEVMWGQRYASQLGVPFRLIHIERPKVKAANITEAKSLALVKQLANVIFVNDLDINTDVGLEATKMAVIQSTQYLEGQTTVTASSFKPLAKEYLKEQKKITD